MKSQVLDRHPEFSTGQTAETSRRLIRREDFESRIDTICDRFTLSTGWQLSFQRIGDLVPSALADQMRMETTCRWFGAIGQRGSISGFLRIDARHSVSPDLDFRRARELAILQKELIDQALTSMAEVNRRTSDVMTILELTRTVPDSNSVSSLLNKILQAAINLTGCYSAAFFLLAPGSERLLLRQYCGPSLGTIPRSARSLKDSPPDMTALQNGMTTIRRERATDEGSWLPTQAKVGLCHRVQSATGPIGTLWLFDRRDFNPGPVEDQIIESLANQAAMTLERSVLEKESREAGRLQKEMVLASESQDMNRKVTNHTCRGVEISCLSCAKDVVGGDLVEVIPVRDQLVFAIGDATGHSIPAAMIMSTVRGSLRTILNDSQVDVDRPDRIIQQINSSYSAYASTGFYMSLFIGVINSKSRILRYSNAGHPGPILLRDRVGRPQQTHGIPLGIDKHANYGMTAISMRKNDVLVGYTDGVTEAKNGDRQLLRTTGLQQALETSDASSADGLIESTVTHLLQHCKGQFDDDYSLIVLRTGI